MVGTTLGPCRVLEKLSAGGMGEVYKARGACLDRDGAEGKDSTFLVMNVTAYRSSWLSI